MISLTDQTPQTPPVSHSESDSPSIVRSTVRWPYFRISLAFMSFLLRSAQSREQVALDRAPAVDHAESAIVGLLAPDHLLIRLRNLFQPRIRRQLGSVAEDGLPDDLLMLAGVDPAGDRPVLVGNPAP